jgi:hypothetical protein
MIFYVGGSDSRKAVVTIGERADVSVNFYAPFGEVEVKEEAKLKGSIVAKDITINKETQLTLSSYFIAHPNASQGRREEEAKVLTELPTTFALGQNYPNPFNPMTNISYQLPLQQEVHLVIYNILGQAVKNLVSGVQPAGVYTIQWDGRNNDGVRVSSGTYFYRLKAGDILMTKKMMLLK